MIRYSVRGVMLPRSGGTPLLSHLSDEDFKLVLRHGYCYPCLKCDQEPVLRRRDQLCFSCRSVDPKKCVGCGSEYEPRTMKQKYCSHPCYTDNQIGHRPTPTPEQEERVLELTRLGFTAAWVGQETGLGYWMVYKIIRKHGGSRKMREESEGLGLL